MRLLNTTSFEIEQFGEYISGSSFHVHDPADTRLPGPPEYAILSHTWGPDELTFQDMQQEAKAKAMLKAGYDKVYRSCQVAKSEGYNWIWIDTCCIDKTSSAELSEAINSMFGYYRDSAVCYAYLGDVSGTQPLSKHDHDDQQWRTDEVPRWYTRGWTLQELIAPYNVQFYSADWRPLGSKHDHLAGISRITNIDSYALEGGDLTRISIARRLAWLAKRETTRMEDMAYCMLGIFDINLTLLYGEGVKAFVRLQEEILRSTNADQSVFAWTYDSGFQHSVNPFVAPKKSSSRTRTTSRAESRISRGEGMLAQSPRVFEMSTAIARFPWHRPARPPPVCTGHGVRVYLLICRDETDQCGEGYLAVLDCQIGTAPGVFAGIRLRKETGDNYSRILTPTLLHIARCDSSGRVLMEGFDPMEKQSVLYDMNTKLPYRDWQPQWIYVAQHSVQKLPAGFWLRISQRFVTVREVQPPGSWDETTHIFQPLRLNKISQKLAAVRLATGGGGEVLLFFGISVSATISRPWCRLLPVTEGQHLVETSGEEAYQQLFHGDHKKTQGAALEEEDRLVIVPRRHSTTAVLNAQEVQVQVQTKVISGTPMHYIELVVKDAH